MPRGTRTILLAAGLVLIVAAVRLPLLSIPLERDEGEYAYIAWRLDYSELPYRDWVDQKPPAVFYIYRLALSLPFEPVRAIHFIGLVFAAASTCALFFLGLRFMTRFWAWVGAGLFALLSADPLVQGTAANTELFMLCPLIFSQIAFFASAARSKAQVLFMALSGALIGIAVMFKQVAIVNWFLLGALYPIFAHEEKRWRGAASFVVWSATGLLSVLGFAALYFWRHGGLNEFVDNVFTHNLEYIGAVGTSARVEYCWGTLSVLARTQAIVWAFAAAGLTGLLTSGRAKWSLFLAGWLLTSFVGVSASGYFFPHYFQQLLPALALAAAAGTESLATAKFWKVLPKWSRRAALTLVLAVLPVLTLWPFLFTYAPAEAVRKIYPGNFFAEMPEFAQRVESITPPEARVFLFGAEPEVLFYAHRLSATRYIFLFPLYGPYGNVREKQVATAAEIERAQPAAAVYLPNALFFVAGTNQYFTEWSLAYLQHNFYADTWLTEDEFGAARILKAVKGGESDSVLGKQQLIGAILVRKPTSAP
jgi:4-amino-4-deoxy-L-arabinose transferase-like glycosyltransferase